MAVALLESGLSSRACSGFLSGVRGGLLAKLPAELLDAPASGASVKQRPTGDDDTDDRCDGRSASSARRSRSAVAMHALQRAQRQCND
eukprot:5210398-Pleurochrysis_carterae.AAC.4